MRTRQSKTRKKVCGTFSSKLQLQVVGLSEQGIICSYHALWLIDECESIDLHSRSVKYETHSRAIKQCNLYMFLLEFTHHNPIAGYFFHEIT
jgi:hypothetical protein